MKWLASSFCLLLYSLAFCDTVETLNQQLRNSLSQQDSFAALYALSDYYEQAGRDASIDSARMYSEWALRLAPNHATRQQLILLHRNLANSFSQTDSASYFRLTQKVRDMYVEDQDFELAARREGQMAVWFMSNNDLQQAHVHYQAAVDLLDKIAEPSDQVLQLQARYIFILGHGLIAPGKYDQAIEKAFELEAFGIANDVPRALALSYDLLGTVYLELFYYDEEVNNHDSLCKAYFKKGAAVAQESDSSLQIRMLQSLGSIYYLTGELDSARNFFNQGYDLAITMNDPWSAYDMAKYQVNIALKKGQLELGDLKIQQIESLLDQFSAPDHIYGELDEMKCRYHYYSKNFATAKHYALSLLERKKFNATEKKLLAYQLLDSIEQKLGNWQEAHKYNSLANIMQDSVVNQKSLYEIDKLNAQHEFDQLKMQTNMEAQGMRKTLILAAALVLLLLSLLAALSFRSRNKVLANQKQTLELEHRLLRSQMNPHFTYNALGSIQNYLMESNHAAKGAVYLAKFSKLMRQILSQSRHTLISLKEEFETLENYIVLQQLRFENRFSYSFHIADNLDPAEVMIPPMLIQPAVENSIEHGKIHKVSAGFLQVKATRVGDMIVLTVTDNGVGKNARANSTSVLKNHTSIATSIIKDRMAMIREEYGKDIDYDLAHPDEGGTIVTYRLPLLTEKEKP